jgi:protein-arginine kinase
MCEFQYSDRLGYIACSPQNLGTGKGLFMYVDVNVCIYIYLYI